MKPSKLFVIFTLGCLLTACAPIIQKEITKTYPKTSIFSKVEVLDGTSDVPESSTRLGTVRIADGGISLKCNYKKYLRIAKREARKAGGNQIYVLNNEGFGGQIFGMLGNSNCHDLTVLVLRKTNTQLIFTYIPGESAYSSVSSVK